MRDKVLVVDDRIATLKGLLALLAEEGYQVLAAGSGQEALELAGEHPDLAAVLADLKMPGMDGLELLGHLRNGGCSAPLVIMTAFGTARSAVKAMKEGVTDYLIKPVDFDELSIVLAKAIRQHRLGAELAALKRQNLAAEGFHGMVGGSAAMRGIFEMIRTVGPTDASVLIRGETGTGKELVARALHAESPRREADLVCINCAALTETLLESELFGHVKGAFTGAVADKKGRLEAAHQGTLFLDEIGHMSLSLQAKLLRFLQERSFEPVGGGATRRVDVRLIAATNLDLAVEIAAGRFLGDLLYRIQVITIEVPPLRSRLEDVPLLADHFARRFAARYGKDIGGLEPGAMERLLSQPWPGNVRELENRLARAVILSKGHRLGVEDLVDPATHDAATAATPGRGVIARIPEGGASLKDVEAELIRKTLAQCGGNKSQAARQLGISRKGLYEKMERYAIEEPE